MLYETIPFVILLSIPLIGGLVLIIDAIRRAIGEKGAKRVAKIS